MAYKRKGRGSYNRAMAMVRGKMSAHRRGGGIPRPSRTLKRR